MLVPASVRGLGQKWASGVQDLASEYRLIYCAPFNPSVGVIYVQFCHLYRATTYPFLFPVTQPIYVCFIGCLVEFCMYVSVLGCQCFYFELCLCITFALSMPLQILIIAPDFATVTVVARPSTVPSIPYIAAVYSPVLRAVLLVPARPYRGGEGTSDTTALITVADATPPGSPAPNIFTATATEITTNNGDACGGCTWTGAVTDPDTGVVYFIPGAGGVATAVNPANMSDATLTLSIGSNATTSNWNGGVYDSLAGLLYGIPSAANNMLEIDPLGGSAGESAGLLSLPAYRSTPNKWAGGVVDPVLGMTVGIPAQAVGILVAYLGGDLFSPLRRIDGHLLTLSNARVGTQWYDDFGANLHGMWHGGVRDPLSGVTFGLPHASRAVLVVSPGCLSLAADGTCDVVDASTHYLLDTGTPSLKDLAGEPCTLDTTCMSGRCGGLFCCNTDAAVATCANCTAGDGGCVTTTTTTTATTTTATDFRGPCPVRTRLTPTGCNGTCATSTCVASDSFISVGCDGTAAPVVCSRRLRGCYFPLHETSYFVAATDILEDNRCVPCESCRAGWYQAGGCEASDPRRNNTVCVPCPPCPRGQYAAVPCTPTSPPQCAPLTTCQPGVAFEAVPPTPSTDRMCTVADPSCALGATYEVRKPTPTSDRVCLPCTNCHPAVEYATVPCTLTSNAQCEAYTVCAGVTPPTVTTYTTSTPEGVTTVASTVAATTEETANPSTAATFNASTTLPSPTEPGSSCINVSDAGSCVLPCVWAGFSCYNESDEIACGDVFNESRCADVERDQPCVWVDTLAFGFCQNAPQNTTTAATTTEVRTATPTPTHAPTLTPTTLAPTTDAPVTVAPTTVAPTTLAPTTPPPSTRAPTITPLVGEFTCVNARFVAIQTGTCTLVDHLNTRLRVLAGIVPAFVCTQAASCRFHSHNATVVAESADAAACVGWTAALNALLGDLSADFTCAQSCGAMFPGLCPLDDVITRFTSYYGFA